MSESLLVATRKGLFRSSAQGGRWVVADAWFLGDNVSVVLPDPRDGALYAALDHGHFGAKLHRSRDGGATWEEIAVPTYPERPADADDVDAHTGEPVDWSLKRIWALEAGGADEPDVLWCGTIPGGLFKSEDAGATWQLNRPLWDHPGRRKWFGGGADQPGIHSICVDPRDNRKVTVAVSCGGVWHSPDGGESWETRASGMRADFMPPEQAYEAEIQDPHRVVQCPAAPDVLWCQHHNGVFRSADEGRKWEEVTTVRPSVFGFAVAVHPSDPETAWFVPAVKDEHRIPVDGQVVVARTRDGGRSFEILREGLPQDHAYDLVYRHALDVDGSGDRLAFGSTTGSLWITGDGGDAWQHVSAHLPPIHAVRFVP